LGVVLLHLVAGIVYEFLRIHLKCFLAGTGIKIIGFVFVFPRKGLTCIGNFHITDRVKDGGCGLGRFSGGAAGKGNQTEYDKNQVAAMA
jgi:hypothetical protein